MFITNTILESSKIEFTNIIESTQIKIYNASIETIVTKKTEKMEVIESIQIKKNNISKEISDEIEKTDKIEIIEKKGEIIFEYMDIYKEELKINDIINRTKIGKNYEIKGKDFILKIKPTNSTIFDNSTHVIFDECEKLLRNHYNIPNTRILTFIQLELDNNDTQSFINQVEYQTISDKKEILDLSICKDINIQIYHSIKDEIYLDMKSISKFNNSGIDIFNIKDKFFNDICESYSDSKNDVILHDRIKYIYQNYSLCNQECSYNNIDLENRTIACICSVKQNMSTIIAPLKLEEEKKSSIMDSNIGVIKCFNLVFSFENKLKNIGFMIFLVLIIINSIFLILYFYNGIKSVLEYIFNEMVKYGYLKRNNKMFFEDTKNNCEKYN